MFLKRALLTSLVFFSAYPTPFSMTAQAEPLKLFSAANPAPLWPGLSQNFNHSPAFHVLQNDPELSSFNTSATSGVTDLCIPSTMANALFYEISMRSPRLTLPVPGVSPDGSVDGAVTVKALIDLCGFTPRTAANPGGGISWNDATACLAKFYSANGLTATKIQYLRKNQPPIAGVDYQDRDPTLQDIKTALASGAEVIGVISYQQQTTRGAWSQSGSHAVNFYGYGANENDPNHLTVYLQNSNRLYSMNFTDPVFDVALLTDDQVPAPVAEKSSSIEFSTLQGRLINFPNKRTFLSALVVIQPQ